MSDSSEEEDLSRFQEAVDNSFTKKIHDSPNQKLGTVSKQTEKNLRSHRYLDEATHYNDVKVSRELQNRIGAKLSDIINKKIEFIDMPNADVNEDVVTGGVKLFKDSEGLLSCNAELDTYTKKHNEVSKKRRMKMCTDKSIDRMDETAKLKLVAVSADYILSKEETKCWKSRRKEKLYRYKGKRLNSVLTYTE